jgi:hypothetical protein
MPERLQDVDYLARASEQGLSQASRLLGKYLLVASGLATSQAGDPKANDDRDAMHWKVS